MEERSMPKILLVDPSTMRLPFLSEMLQASGEVTRFGEADKALAAVKRGLGVDVAVLHYRLSLTPLIQAIKTQRPAAKIVAFGSPRADTPLGVDQYLNQPILSAELGAIVERMATKRRSN
jgi:CheY-like chemotaxis protein